MDKFGRPEWDEFYLALAMLMATRSLDPRTKHGAVLVSADGRPLSIGYNGPIRGMDNDHVPLQPPHKYYVMLHAEENSLLAYAGSHSDIQGATAYITGTPCNTCLRMLIQKGVTRIVHAHVGSVMLHTAEPAEQECKALMINERDIEIVEHPNPLAIRAALEGAISYFDLKWQQKLQSSPSSGGVTPTTPTPSSPK